MAEASEPSKKSLTPDQIAELLKPTRTPKGISTEPRVIDVWFKQNHLLREEGCDNPDCTDDRPYNDRGRKIVIKIGDKHMCRFCFLNGWLSPNGASTT